MKNLLCIHGHFYQPPRENPWLEAIEAQKSAAPYHDWNERITAECYAPNCAARLLNAAGEITSLVNNYQHISFNFGPTLLSWIEKEDKKTYNAILAADSGSVRQHNGHGAAIAQAWGHIILPLANARDKKTQITWGVRDFIFRFNRKPEGMWLPEAAVDLETLEVLADAGILFTILSPLQARRIRENSESPWKSVEGGTIDSGRPYLCHLPSGKTISIFFYAGGLSHDVAFGGLLNSGDLLASSLKEHAEGKSQLTHIATDGESYGHHHKFGEMALARAIELIRTDPSVQLTVYGEFLDKHPPEIEVEIIPMSSWSCAHGVERWRSDCGCHIGTDPSWNQKWRAPLRHALDELRDRLAPLFETFAGELFINPWATRDAYIEVILDRSTSTINKFLDNNSRHKLSPAERQRGLELLEMQRHAMQMYTSCGWFFDEVSGIETLQLLAYAARAIDLARAACGVDLEPAFRKDLRLVPGNLKQWPDADTLFQEKVIPQIFDFQRIAANYAIATLLGAESTENFYCYTVQCTDLKKDRLKSSHSASGVIHLRSDITLKEASFDFAAVHLGGLKIIAGVAPHNPSPDRIRPELLPLLQQNNPDTVTAEIKRVYGEKLFTLAELFLDERQNNAKQLVHAQTEKLIEQFREIYRGSQHLLTFFHENSLVVPEPFAAAAEQLLNYEILETLRSRQPLSGRIQDKLLVAKNYDLKLDQSLLSHAARERCDSILEELAARPDDVHLLKQAHEDLKELMGLPWPINLWHSQNICFEIHRQAETKALCQRDEKEKRAWEELFIQLAKTLGIRFLHTTA